MKTQDIFKVGKEFFYCYNKEWHRCSNHIGNNFKEWFYDMKVKIDDSIKLDSRKLIRDMNDREILSEFKPDEVTLGEVYSHLKNRDMDKSTPWIFYVRDRDNVLRSVYVHWLDGGWGVNAFSVESPSTWDGGYQVFSRAFKGKANNSLPTELTINGVVYIKK